MAKFNNVQFPDKLVLVHAGGSDWLVKDPYRCIWDGGSITVPKGFSTDLSSIPRAFRSIIPVVGNQNGPSVIHDWCYVNQWRNSRADSDDLLLYGLEAAGVWWLRRNAMYLAVRAGGWTVWNNHSE